MNGDRFIVRAGSVCGRAHRSLDQANQDAVYCHSWDGGLVAVVCDGCGSAPHSGMGAALGCRLTAGALVRRQNLLAEAASTQDAERYLAAVEEDVLTALSVIVAGCPNPSERIIHDCLLFTVLGIALCGEQAVLFALGDGVLGYNGMVEVLGPYPDNAPPYLGYALLPDRAPLIPHPEPADHTLVDALRPVVSGSVEPRGAGILSPTSLACHAFLSTADLHTAVIGTDGLVDALRGAACLLPGTAEPFGPLCQFWEDDRYVQNPDLLRRRLARAARAVPGTPAILSDDTSLVVIRRIPERCP